MSRAAADPVRAAETKLLRRRAGAWLRERREAAGLTQVELARRAGIRYYTFVSQVESGQGRVPIDAQAVWAAALGVDPTEFAKTLLQYYEPELFRLLFGNARSRARLSA